MNKQKTAIIDVGGGFRGVYAAGVLDRVMDMGIAFDHCYGVSAGSANLSSYLSGQPGRTYRFYSVFSARKEYASPGNFMKEHNFANLDYVYGTLSNSDGEYPLDYPALRDNPAQFTVVAMDALTGEAKYFDKSDIHQDDYSVMKASSSVPVANQPYVIDGVPYYDGGMADPIPVSKALVDGADKVVIVLTRQRDYERSPKPDVLPARILSRTYPKAAESLQNRYDLYNSELELAHRLEEAGKVLIVAPDDLCGLNTLNRSQEGIERMYRKGYANAAVIADFVEE
ncbi:patatin family protein [Bombiscardovia apis]|uniref:Patatin family protein n=1 Tax=Bombiscardovia apis TaxID=2932182 RepID=A0ABN6SI97_9BIFI|nr:patatin family protein [Bombiscardovia apis]BDR54340.1 patatin family protein [Bombiscardovia apis]